MLYVYEHVIIPSWHLCDSNCSIVILYLQASISLIWHSIIASLLKVINTAVTFDKQIVCHYLNGMKHKINYIKTHASYSINIDLSHCVDTIKINCFSITLSASQLIFSYFYLFLGIDTYYNVDTCYLIRASKFYYEQ